MSFDCTKWNWGLWNHQHLQVHRSTDTLTDMAAKSICIQCMYFNKMVRRPSKDLHVKVGPWMEGGNKENGWAPSCTILCSLALLEEDPISEIFFLCEVYFAWKNRTWRCLLLFAIFPIFSPIWWLDSVVVCSFFLTGGSFLNIAEISELNSPGLQPEKRPEPTRLVPRAMISARYEKWNSAMQK